MLVYFINNMPSKVSNRVSSAAKRASSRVSKSVSKSVKSVRSMRSEQIVICVLLVVLVVLVIYYVNQNTSERFSNDSEPVVLYLFYVDWCPHCKTAKPQVAELEKQLNNKPVNGKNVVVKQVNCEGTDEERALAKENDVKAYPTIVLKNGDNTIEYEQAVSVENLNAFLNENV